MLKEEREKLKYLKNQQISELKNIIEYEFKLEEIKKKNEEEKLFNEVEMPLANILADMEIEGFPIDVKIALRGLEDEFRQVRHPVKVNAPVNPLKHLFSAESWKSVFGHPSGDFLPGHPGQLCHPVNPFFSSCTGRIPRRRPGVPAAEVRLSGISGNVPELFQAVRRLQTQGVFPGNP